MALIVCVIVRLVVILGQIYEPVSTTDSKAVLCIADVLFIYVDMFQGSNYANFIN